MAAPRASSYLRTRPRAWGRLVDAQTSLLTDGAWIVRELRAEGTVDGTPNFAENLFGGLVGYAAKLSTPTESEHLDPDKWSTDWTHTLAIASDVVPLISDGVLVYAPVMLNQPKLVDPTERRQLAVRFRITGQVLSRRAASGRALIHHVQLQRLTQA